MRYEARHKYFKKIGQILGNFKNIEKTVASRHQRHMCYKMTCSNHFLGGENAFGPGTNYNFTHCTAAFGYTARSVTVDELKYAIPLLQFSQELNCDSVVHRYNYEVP